MGNLLIGTLTESGVGLPAEPVGKVKLYFSDREMTDLWIAITWGGS